MGLWETALPGLRPAGLPRETRGTSSPNAGQLRTPPSMIKPCSSSDTLIPWLPRFQSSEYPEKQNTMGHEGLERGEPRGHTGRAGRMESVPSSIDPPFILCLFTALAATMEQGSRE